MARAFLAVCAIGLSACGVQVKSTEAAPLRVILPGLLDLKVAEGHELDPRCADARMARGQLGLACVTVVSDPAQSAEVAREAYGAQLRERGWRKDQTRSQAHEIWLSPPGDPVGCVDLLFAPGVPEEGHLTGGAISASKLAEDCGGV